jgi:hypothetical protein
MDSLGRTIGNGISGLMAGAVESIGAAVRGIVDAGERALPNGLLWAVVFVVMLIGAWTLAKR